LVANGISNPVPANLYIRTKIPLDRLCGKTYLITMHLLLKTKSAGGARADRVIPTTRPALTLTTEMRLHGNG
jgi:hypothetical protein